MNEQINENNQEGTLSIDVYTKDDELVILAPIAGASLDNIEILVEDDILIIKGQRVPPEIVEENNYQHKECFWGAFSRTIILPRDLDYDNIKAFYHNGILTIRIPKKTEKSKKRIFIQTE
jgi:HSP20 family protein